MSGQHGLRAHCRLWRVAVMPLVAEGARRGVRGEVKGGREGEDGEGLPCTGQWCTKGVTRQGRRTRRLSGAPGGSTDANFVDPQCVERRWPSVGVECWAIALATSRRRTSELGQGNGFARWWTLPPFRPRATLPRRAACAAHRGDVHAGGGGGVRAVLLFPPPISLCPCVHFQFRRSHSCIAYSTQERAHTHTTHILTHTRTHVHSALANRTATVARTISATGRGPRSYRGREGGR